MSGSGPAGEVTYADVKSRLSRVLAHISAAETDHEATAAAIAQARDVSSQPGTSGQGD